MAIPTYYLVVSLSCLVGSLWFLKRAAQARLPHLFSIDLSLITVLCGFLGARLLHVFYEEPAFYFANPLNVFFIWNGGFVFLGGLIGATMGAAIFCERRGQPFWVWSDVAAPPAALAYALGRIGCFLNGCCYGHKCTVPWSFMLEGVRRHPTQLYATVWEFGVLATLLIIERRTHKTGASKSPGSLFGKWLILHGIGRLIMEAFRADPRGPEMMGLSISSWLSLGLIGGGLALVLQYLIIVRSK